MKDCLRDDYSRMGDGHRKDFFQRGVALADFSRGSHKDFSKTDQKW